MFDLIMFIGGAVLIGVGVALGWCSKSFLQWLERK